ncbi:MAG: TetR/AcrR family transcriptional regulator [Lachnospiraceae bacterium]|nr:TetR/AcrR family transcriptional regulator [Lachnospiraceae bacterium]
MARKTQISKEIILDAAFRMLVMEGYASINIKALAKEIGCSTQPIAWHFGSMEGLKTELLDYCVRFLGRIFCGIKSEHVSEQLEDIAYGYITLAFDYPNLYRYFYMSDVDGRKMNELTTHLRADNYEKAIGMLQKEYEVSAEDALKHMIDLQMYVHGVASYVVTQGGFSAKEEVMEMIHRANLAFLSQLK